MLKRRRRSAATVASDLPFCAMCGQAIRVDAASGRCALGHRVTVPAADVAAPAPEAPVIADLSAPVLPLGGYVDERLAAFGPTAGEEAPWDTGAGETQQLGAIDDFLTWDGDEAEGYSALDVDTAELPVAAERPAPPVAAAPATPVAEDLLDELDDAARARRRAVGTIGAAIAFTGAVFGSIAILPF